jgi:uncharacterized protein (TIGR00251 family)
MTLKVAGDMSDAPSPWPLRARDGAVRVAIRVQPRASRTALVGRHGDAIKVQLAAPPVDGAANEALVRWLARDVLGIAPGRVRIVHGDTGRDKILAIEGMSLDDIAAALNRAQR